METFIKSSAINYGLYLGAILSIITIAAYAINLDLFINMAFGISLFVLTITLAILSLFKSKKILNGFISFKDAFSSYFITIAIAVIISSIISFVIFNFVDPEAAIVLKEKAMDNQVEMLKNFGSPEETIEQVVEAGEKSGDLFSIINILKSTAGYLVFYSIIGLIIALILKKEDPDA